MGIELLYPYERRFRHLRKVSSFVLHKFRVALSNQMGFGQEWLGRLTFSLVCTVDLQHMAHVLRFILLSICITCV